MSEIEKKRVKIDKNWKLESQGPDWKGPVLMHTLNVFFFVKKESCLIRKVAKGKEEEEK
jgi:hypothetical protein